MKINPPRLAQRFFSWYCRNQLHDSILGDLDEQFHQNLITHSVLTAKLLYWVNVFQFINRHTLRRDRFHTSYNYYSTSMIKNNVISSLRFFGRNKGFTMINIIGLTLGFGSFLLILLYVNHELSFDQFHENKEDVYRINFSFQDNGGNVTTLVNSPPALAPGIRDKYPELEKISRMRYAANSLLANGDIQFYEDNGFFADSLFLEILQFELASGDRNTALDLPNSIVITEELALKYFNDQNPIGATLVFNNSIPLKITGILSSIPSNSHLDFNFLISFPTYMIPEGYASDLTSWSWLGFLTYIKLKPDTDPRLFETKLAQHFQELDPEDPTPMLPIIQSLSDIYLDSSGMSDDLASHIRSGSRFNIDMLSVIAILILAVAGFNFSNLSHALSINRGKSIGVRKVLGATRKNIISQMMSESFILTFICSILSLTVLVAFFPDISQFLSWEFSLGFVDLLPMIPTLLIAGALVGIVSGSYPAFMLAKFDTIKSLKGTLKIASRNPLQAKNVLVTLQFAISIGLIVAASIISQQIHYLQNYETGYNAENIVLIKALPEEMSSSFEAYKEKLVQNTSVTEVSRSDRVVGDIWPFSVIQRTDEGPESSKRIFYNQADYDFFKTMGISVQDGRTFSKDHINDPLNSVVINRQAAKLLNLEDPVGKQVHFFEQDGPRTIIGIVDDFNYSSLHQEVGPAAIILPFIDLEYMYVRFNGGNPRAHITLLENTWQEVSEGSAIEWRFLDDRLMQLYQSEEQLAKIIQAFSILVVLLACLGLYGIVTFMINNRIKEIGVRKVLGASVPALYSLFTKTYFYQIVLAMILIFPLVNYFLNNWLKEFAYRIDIDVRVYLFAALLLAFLTFASVTFQILKSARANPTQLLRHE